MTTRLSPSQLAVMRLVAEGMPNKEIAQKLEVSAWTVQTQLRRAFQKLGARDRAHATSRCYQTGVLKVEERP